LTIVIILNACPFNISGNALFALLRFEQLKNVIIEKKEKKNLKLIKGFKIVVVRCKQMENLQLK